METIEKIKSKINCPVSIPNLIRKKRDKQELSESEIEALVNRLISKEPASRLHDSQVGAFLMATFLNGLSPAETSSLTKAMTYSGYNFTWPLEWKGTVVDKHSTGGVGDKVSLVLAPALAACGLRVPMISGRGLDFTGGTLDKLESIPGFTVLLSKEKMRDVLETVGCCIVGQTEDIVPADKLIYAIRDITATVDREELIVGMYLICDYHLVLFKKLKFLFEECKLIFYSILSIHYFKESCRRSGFPNSGCENWSWCHDERT